MVLNGNRRAGIVLVACLIGFTTLGLGIGLAQNEEPDVVAAGVRVDGWDLGGKTPAEADRALREIAERKVRAPLLLGSGRTAIPTNARALGGRCDAPAALQAVLKAGRSENWLERLRDHVQGPGADCSVPLLVSFEPAQFARELRRLARSVEQPPIEPKAREEGGNLIASGGRPGRLLDEQATAQRVQSAMADSTWAAEVAASVREAVPLSEWEARARPLKLELVLSPAAPRLTAEAVAEAQVLLATFTTSFSLRDRNRVHNIRLAARAINGTYLLPGDEFSYNSTVGPRRRRAGFRTAPEIVRGVLVPGIGGGVCQVSTTLYNAALLADLQVTRRYHHRFPVHYVAAGRDATVSDGGLDLRLRNGLGAPVVLMMAVEGARIRARVFGAEQCKRSVRLLTTRLRPAYTKTGGRRVALVRVVEENGRAVRREIISSDSYEPPPASSH